MNCHKPYKTKQRSKYLLAGPLFLVQMGLYSYYKPQLISKLRKDYYNKGFFMIKFINK